MNFKNILKNKITQVVFIILILVFLVGFMTSKPISFKRGYLRGQKEMEEKYEKRLVELFPELFAEKEILSVYGEIVEIKDNALVVEIFSPSTKFFEDSKLNKKLVKIKDSTSIIKQVEKPYEEFMEEQEKYMKVLGENPETDILAPRPFREVEIHFSDFKVGCGVSIEADNSIKDKTEFFAKKITLQLIPQEE